MDTEIKTKVCAKCKETKPLDAFHKHSGGEDGYLKICKVCRSKYYKAKVAAQKNAEPDAVAVPKQSQKTPEEPSIDSETETEGDLPAPPLSPAPQQAKTQAFPASAMSYVIIDVVLKMEQLRQDAENGMNTDALAGAYEAALELAVRLRMMMEG